MHVPKQRRVVLIATSNHGKLRDFAAAAAEFGIDVAPLPGISDLPPAREDAPTFEANACKKVEYYSSHVPNQLVLADDSGLRVDALQGAPGVRSARYAADESGSASHENSADRDNNARLIRELKDVQDVDRTARFICAIAAGRDGRTLVVCRGEVHGLILREPRGSGGFGYDPLFYLPERGKTFAELSPEQKSGVSHRGQAFRKFLQWCKDHPAELRGE